MDGFHLKLKKNASNKLEMADTTRDDMAILSYTSGTTGNPKAVTLSWMGICTFTNGTKTLVMY